MKKKSFLFLVVLLVLSFMASPVLAQTDGTTTVTATTTATTKSADVAAKISCVKTAVATREAALSVSVGNHMQSVQAAYATRANTLAGAYANTNAKAVQAGVKVAWDGFRKDIKAASSKWKTDRNSAWSAFRVATKACKAASNITDAHNSGSELNGQ